MPRRTRGLRSKLARVYALQVGLISVAALVGVFITYLIVQDVLTRQALNEEAHFFWEQRAQSPSHPLPVTANMVGYLVDGSDASLPEPLQGLTPGFGRASGLPGNPLVHTSERDGKTLHLVFAEEQVSSLVFYFGLAPLAAVLLSVYALLFITYRLSHQAISPVLNLAQTLEDFDFRGEARLELPVQSEDADTETKLLFDALDEFSQRLQRFIDRERLFTRNAGHELRTPMAVLKGSLDLLDSAGSADPTVLARMRRVLDDMETLLETLITLAREEDAFDEAGCSVNHTAFEEAELLSELAESHGNRLRIEELADAHCNAKRRVLGIILSNLLRNALTYTEAGEVTIRIDRDRFMVADTGLGIAPEDLEHIFSTFYRSDRVKNEIAGQGLGLALVQRLCKQLGWEIEVESQPEEGTRFTVHFTPVSHASADRS